MQALAAEYALHARKGGGAERRGRGKEGGQPGGDGETAPAQAIDHRP